MHPVEKGLLALVMWGLAASAVEAQARRPSPALRPPAVAPSRTALPDPRAVRASSPQGQSVAPPRNWVAEGALFGAVLGAAAGAYTMATSGCGGDSQDDGCVAGAIVLLTVGGAAGGALVGAVAEWVVPDRKALAHSRIPCQPDLHGRALTLRRLTRRCS